MTRDFELGDGSSVPNLRPSRGSTIKDLILYATVLTAVGGWLWRAARDQVGAADMESVKTEMRSALSAMDRRTSAIEKDLAVTVEKVGTISKTTERIENKLDEKHRR